MKKTYCEPVDNATEAIMGATRPMLKGEVQKLLGELYNAGYDDGRAVGYEAAEVDSALDADYHFSQGYDAGRAECP
jgi:hypothetical protein